MRRRPKSWAMLPVAVVLVGLSHGYDHLCQTWQTQEVWQGTIVRVYHESSLLKTRRRNKADYWDVSTSNGSVRSVRVYSPGLWGSARPGDWVAKRSGELDPILIGHR